MPILSSFVIICPLIQQAIISLIFGYVPALEWSVHLFYSYIGNILNNRCYSLLRVACYQLFFCYKLLQMCTIHIDAMWKQSRAFDAMNRQIHMIHSLTSLWMSGFVFLMFVKFLTFNFFYLSCLFVHCRMILVFSMFVFYICCFFSNTLHYHRFLTFCDSHCSVNSWMHFIWN